MLTNDSTTAYRVDTDLGLFTLTTLCMTVKCTAGCIKLFVVMLFDYLNIEFTAKRRNGFFSKLDKKSDADRHVS